MLIPTSPLRLALVQASPTPGDVASNARAAGRFIAAAADRGAHLVVFPELFLTGYELRILESTPSAWIEEDDARLAPAQRACEAGGAVAVLGAALRDRSGAPRIAAPVLAPNGDLRMWTKEHLHGTEGALFQRGAPSAPFDVKGWRVALGICFDAAHPRHAERAAAEGADLYAVSALYTRSEIRRCDLHFGARAMDNRIFSALANYAGETGGHAACGLSGVWRPTGDVLNRAEGAGESLVIVDLDPQELAPYRSAS